MKKKLNIVMLVAMSLLIVVLVFVAYFNEAWAGSEMTYLYHKHSGSEDTGGGCYGTPVMCSGTVLQKTKEIKCGSFGSIRSENEWVCHMNGHVDINSIAGGWYTFPHAERCNFVTGTEGYFECDKCGSVYDTYSECTKVVGYEMSCGVKEGTPMVSCQVKPDNTGWCGSLNLKMEVVELTEENQGVSWIWGDGSVGDSLKVMDNGNYTVTIPETELLTGAELSIHVSNIDRDVPVIHEVKLSTKEPTTSVTVTVTASDATSGLNYAAYKWDGGEYQVQNTKTYDRNGIYSIQVRDGVGNTIFQNIFIENIVDASQIETVPNPEILEIEKPLSESKVELKEESEENSKVELKEESEENSKIELKEETEEKPEEKSFGDNLKLPEENGKGTQIFPVEELPEEPPMEEVQIEKPTAEETVKEAILTAERTKDKNAMENRREVMVQTEYTKKGIGARDVIIFLGISIGISLIVILIFACISGYCTLHKKKKSDKIAMSNYS